MKTVDEGVVWVRDLVDQLYVFDGKLLFDQRDVEAEKLLVSIGLRWKAFRIDENGNVINFSQPWDFELRQTGEYEGKLAQLLKEARKDRTAFKAAEKLVERHLTLGRPLPRELADHIQDRLNGKPFPKREKNKHRGRDEAIAMLVKNLVRLTGIHPYRNEQPGERKSRAVQKSGIDLVLAVLDNAGKGRNGISYSVGKAAFMKYGGDA